MNTSPTPGTTIETINYQNLDLAVDIHMRAYEGRISFSRELGSGFVTDTYSYFLETDGCMSFLAWVDSKPAGFIFTSPFVTFAPLQKYRKRAALNALLRRPWLIIKPSVGRRLLERFFSKEKVTSNTINMPVNNYQFTYSIAVNPDYQGRQVGKALLDALENKAQETNRDYLTIGVGKTNIASLALCAKCGYKIIDGLTDGENLYFYKAIR